MVFIGPISSIFDYATYGMMLYVFDCLEQSSAVPDRMVRRIPADPDAHHPYHPNREDPVHRKPCKPGTYRDDGNHLHGRNVVALHLGRFGVRFRAASMALLAPGRGHDGDIRDTHAPCEGLVRPQVGTLRRPVRRELLAVRGRVTACGARAGLEAFRPGRPQLLAQDQGIGPRSCAIMTISSSRKEKA